MPHLNGGRPHLPALHHWYSNQLWYLYYLDPYKFLEDRSGCNKDFRNNCPRWTTCIYPMSRCSRFPVFLNNPHCSTAFVVHIVRKTFQHCSPTTRRTNAGVLRYWSTVAVCTAIFIKTLNLYVRQGSVFLFRHFRYFRSSATCA